MQQLELAALTPVQYVLQRALLDALDEPGQCVFLLNYLNVALFLAGYVFAQAVHFFAD